MSIRTLILLAGVAGGVYAQRPYPGVTFLLIWPGARPTALAGAYTAVADDAYAPAFNPAGLAFVRTTSATFTHAPWLPGLWPGMFHEYLGGVHPVTDRMTAGFHGVFLPTVSGIGWDHDCGSLEFAAGPSFGLKVSENLGVGLGFKLIYSQLSDDWLLPPQPGLRGIAWAFDGGVLYRFMKFLNVGAALANFGPDIDYNSLPPPGTNPEPITAPLPWALRLAFSWTPIHSRLFEVLVTPEFTKVLVGMFYDPLDSLNFSQELACELRETWKSIGLEFRHLGIFALRVGAFFDPVGGRGGFRFDDQGRITRWPLTYGVGVRLGRLSVDIGCDQDIYDFETSNYKLSLTHRF